MIEEEYIRLIFGLKLKQIRTDKNLSLFGLAKITGLSKSYLNEIEKGKKYPKRDKIIILAEAMDVTYDQMVSLKLDKNLAPIGEILQSRILKEIPLEIFGIKESNLIDIIAEAPLKVNAFISTLFEIAKHYNLTRESFFLAALRSYQEAHNNYFEDLELQVEKFAKAYSIDLTKKLKLEDLEEILTEEYGYTINNEELTTHKELIYLRSVFVPKSKTLLVSKDADISQRMFIYAKEIAYNYLEISERLYTFSWIKFESFDQVLNNFFASYFAGALLIPRKELVKELKVIFERKSFEAANFTALIARFTDSPETFYQRLTNILPKDFNLKNIFFLRFNYKPERNDFQLTKELHITNLLEPHGNENNEHYCRRWISIKTLQEIPFSKESHLFDSQISSYNHTDNEYFVISSATKDPFRSGYYRSIALGIMISPHSQSKIQFLNSPDIKKRRVGVTCESCAIADCAERAVPPKKLERKLRNEATDKVVQSLMEKYS
ncbi:helix-turn-helix domain-containing protein [Flavobacterium humi]|uniref:XRE family transcriptional regulator n=1 Tax=Flavobacterium humi TaxID=2562683 RepID=A0A4Z0LA21_9FLAO|nr:helix-turn-helix transcriptional regulator [Flavobacterium humi]TGD58060.1 XRE family transcriptional regulator [Flavobacterium humi]